MALHSDRSNYLARPRLRQELEANGRRQTWLAAQCGISAGYLWRVINARRAPSIELAERIAAALSLPLADLFVRVDVSELTHVHEFETQGVA